MSKPIRYGLADADLGRIHPQADGHLVMWADYAALAAEYERLKAENERLRQHRYTPQEIDSIRADIDKLHAEFNRNLFKKVCAENERLRKAGDKMDAYLKRQDGTTNGMLDCRRAWLEAKEEGDAK